MLYESILMETAIYQFLGLHEDEETEDLKALLLKATPLQWSETRLESVALGLIILNLIVMMTSTNYFVLDPAWGYVEIVCGCGFVFEILFRYDHTVRSSSSQMGICGVYSGTMDFIRNPLNLFDIIVTIAAFYGAVVRTRDAQAGSYSYLGVLRVIRLFRLGHVSEFISGYLAGVAQILHGIINGLQTVFFTLLVISCMAMAIACLLRSMVAVDEARGTTLPDGMEDLCPGLTHCTRTVVRCMILHSDGACVAQNGKDLLNLVRELGLASYMDEIFLNVWILFEVGMTFGVANAVAAIFVVQASAHERDVRARMTIRASHEDGKRLKQLDKVLRTLTHPFRKHASTKDRNIASVTQYIQNSFPNVATSIPDLTTQLVTFAEQIQESKEKYRQALDAHEAEDMDLADDLKAMPECKVFLLDGEQKLLVDPCESLIGSPFLKVPCAPDGALEVLLLQETNDLQTLLSEASEAQRLIKQELNPKTEWAAIEGAAMSSGDIWRASGGVCDEAIDPGIKDASRIAQKVAARYGGRYDRNRDYGRIGLVYNSVGHLLQGLKKLLEKKSRGFEVVRVENRFTEPTPLGWRDVCVLMRVKVASTGHMHVMELQLQLRGLMQVRDTAHDFYSKIRGILPEEVVQTIIDQLTMDMTLDLGITKLEWQQCMRNDKVMRLMDQLNVPIHVRNDLFDVIDSDGSGVVTSAELHEGLLLCRGPPSSHDIVGCRLQVREVQQLLKNHIEPKTRIIHDQLVENKTNADLRKTTMKMGGKRLSEDCGPSRSDKIRTRTLSTTHSNAGATKKVRSHNDGRQTMPKKNEFLDPATFKSPRQAPMGIVISMPPTLNHKPEDSSSQAPGHKSIEGIEARNATSQGVKKKLGGGWISFDADADTVIQTQSSQVEDVAASSSHRSARDSVGGEGLDSRTCRNATESTQNIMWSIDGESGVNSRDEQCVLSEDIVVSEISERARDDAELALNRSNTDSPTASLATAPAQARTTTASSKPRIKTHKKIVVKAPLHKKSLEKSPSAKSVEKSPSSPVLGDSASDAAMLGDSALNAATGILDGACVDDSVNPGVGVS
jgi:hypothetical protein